MEKWERIANYEDYLISTHGRVKSPERLISCKGNSVYLRKERILKLKKHRNGYLCIALSKNSERKMFQVHRLVAIAFLPNPENKPQVNHINGIKNDNRVENLEWCTAKENSIHSRDVLGFKVSEETKKKLSKITTERNLENHPMAVPIIVNGVWFKNLREASLFYGKHEGYFSELVKRRKTNEKSCPQWNIDCKKAKERIGNDETKN